MVPHNRIGCLERPVSTIFSRRRSDLFAALGFLSLILSVAQLSADVTLPNLPPGSQYQLAFLTAEGRDGTSTDIADYNTFVTQQAALSSSLPAGVTWHAIASTATVNAVDNAPSSPSIPVYNTYGQQVTASGWTLYQALTTPLSNPIAYDQYGVTTFDWEWGGRAWTGCGLDGTASCPLGSAVPMLGVPAWTDAGWLSATNTYNNGIFPLYALSSIITVPEPTALALLGTALLGIGGVMFLRRKQMARARAHSSAIPPHYRAAIVCVLVVPCLATLSGSVHGGIVGYPVTLKYVFNSTGGPFDPGGTIFYEYTTTIPGIITTSSETANIYDTSLTQTTPEYRYYSDFGPGTFNGFLYVTPESAPVFTSAMLASATFPSFVPGDVKYNSHEIAIDYSGHGGTGTVVVDFTTVPEPSTIVLSATAAASLLFMAWQRGKRN